MRRKNEKTQKDFDLFTGNGALQRHLMVPVLGAVQEQDGIKVTLTTDKDTYAKGETISAVLSVENTNEEAVQNVTLKNYVPDGYKLAENAEEVKTAAAYSRENPSLQRLLTCQQKTKRWKFKQWGRTKAGQQAE